jgi:CubicO group peptidase (beta-lactamase class C family)
MTAAPTRGLDGVLAEELATWPGPAGVAVVGESGVLASAGDLTTVFPWASVTKVVTALVVLQAARNAAVALDDPVGPPGSTLRHLLAHASGVAFEGEKVLAEPGRRRIYSNRGIEMAADHAARRTGRAFAELARETLLDPLGMTGTHLVGSPAAGAEGPVSDLALLARELIAPRCLDAHRVAEATRTTYPGLAGVLPGFGRQDPNDWGLGIEVRATKAPHWTTDALSPETFGHFGHSGSFIWVDPTRRIGCVAAGAEAFGPWALEAWPQLGRRVLQRIVPVT